MAKTFTNEFETEVLHSLTINPQFLKESINLVRPEYFVVEMNARAFKVIAQTYIKTRSAPSRIGFLSALVQEEETVNKVKEKDKQKLILEPCQKLTDYLYSTLPKSVDVEARWIEFCRQREIENALLTNLQQLETGETDTNRAVEAINKTHKRVNTSNQGGLSFFDNLDTFSVRMKEQKKKKISTGFRSLDLRCDGGFAIETLTTYIASSKGGKSMVLSHTGYMGQLYNKNVAHFTLEISENEIEARNASRISGIPMSEISKRSDEMAEKCAEFAEVHKCKYLVKGWPSGTVGVAELRNYLYWAESDSGFRPDLILVDYGDCLIAKTAYNEERFKLKEIWTEMRAMAQEFHCPVLTASQTNRQGFDKAIIRMQDVAEDIQKVNISDYILTICKTQEEDAANKARIFLAGSRCARAGLVVPITYDWERAFMMESSERLTQDEVFK